MNDVSVIVVLAAAGLAVLAALGMYACERRPERQTPLPGLELTTWWRAYLTCALMCGLRPGELLRLRWEDVDFKAGVLRVRKCLKALPDPATGKRQLVLENLKTERSKRTIRMPAQVTTALLALRKEQAAVRLKLGAAYDVGGLAIVFCDGALARPSGPRTSGATSRRSVAGPA